MSHSTIERAARALCEKSFEDPNEVVATIGEAPGTPVYAWQHRTDDVRAVLEAIQEPSRDVPVAMREPFGTHSDGWPISHDNRDRWRAGVEAILATATP